MTTPEADTWFSEETATFGDRLAAAREAAGHEPAELARRLGVRARTLAQWEADAAEPRANRLQMLAGMLNVSLMWLLTGAGDGIDPPGDGRMAGRGARRLTALAADLAGIRAETATLAGRLGRVETELRALLSDLPASGGEGR